MWRVLRREQYRADRNGSVFALLSIALPCDDVRPISDILQRRLRITDDAGWLHLGEIGVLLPETSGQGAWQLARSLAAELPADYPRPEFDVYVHPEPNPDDGHPPHDVDDGWIEPADDRQREIAGGPQVSAALAPMAFQSRPVTQLLARPLPWWKRLLDVGGAAIGVLLLSPVMLLAAAAVKLTSPGPAIFAQQREGRAGRPFTLFKFRTMVVEAERLKSDLMNHNEQDGPAFKIERDPRVTPVGHFLRATSLDELPQLWNVLRGEMSLVGPRPLPVSESQACEDWQRRRLEVLPGLTCIWQTRDRRNKLPFDDWMRLDLAYVRRLSPWLDLRLIAQTVAMVALRVRFR